MGPQATQIGFPTDRRNRHGDAERGLPMLVSMRLSAYGKLPSRDRPRVEWIVVGCLSISGSEEWERNDHVIAALAEEIENGIIEKEMCVKAQK